MDKNEILNNTLTMVEIAIQIKRDCGNKAPIGCNTGKKSRDAFFKSIQYKPKKYIRTTTKAFKTMMSFDMPTLEKIKADTQTKLTAAASNKKNSKTKFKF